MASLPRIRTLVVAVALALGVARAAHADNDGASAGALFDEARQAFDRKDYHEAAQKFDEANRRAPRGQTAFNAALSWDAAGEPARAADDFALALEDAMLPQTPSAQARTRLTAIERTVMTLHVESVEPARATIAHVDGRVLPINVHLRPGNHPLTVRFERGRTVRQEVEAHGSERVSLRVAPPDLDEAPAKPSPVAPVTPPSLPRREAPPAARDPGSTQRTLAYVAGGAGAAALAVGIVLGLKGLGARDDFDASQQTDAGARSSAVSLRTGANVCFIAAGVLAGAGVALYLTAPSAHVAIGVGSVSGTF